MRSITCDLCRVLLAALTANAHGVQPSCLDSGDADILEAITSANESGSISLLQVNSAKAANLHDIVIDNTQIDYEALDDQMASQDAAHDMRSAMRLADVAFGLVGVDTMMMLNKQQAHHPKVMMHSTNMTEGDWVTLAGDDDVSGVAPLTWVFGSYHKTGCQLALGICWVLGGHAANNIERSIQDGYNGPLFNTKAWSNWFFEPDLDVIMKLEAYRFVHMIRLPAAQIVSAYRYHCHIREDTEDWLRYPMNDPEQWCMFRGDCRQTFTRYGILPKLHADERLFHSVIEPPHYAIMRKFFEAVDAGKTLPEYYASVPATEGIIVESYRSFTTLNMMSDNYRLTRHDPWTVQLRMENIKADFDGTMSCMFNFLKKSHDMDADWLTKRVDPLNVEKYGSAASHAHQPWHINHDDNTELFEVLSNVQFVQEKDAELSMPAMNDC